MNPRPLRTLALVTVLALAATACGDDDLADTTSEPGPPTETTDPTDTADTAGQEPSDGGDANEAAPLDLTDWQSSRPECEDGPDRTITHLEPVVIPAISLEEIRVPDETVAGHAVPGFVIPAVQLPEQIVDTGCIVEHHAPAGCLPAMEISAVEVPETVLPAAEIPSVTIDGEEHPARVAGERRAGAREQTGRSVDQRCQREPRSGQGIVSAVIRPAMVRPAVVRQAQLRQGVQRRPICIDGECTSPVNIPPASIPAVGVPAVSVEGAVLETRILDDAPAQVIEQDTSTTYEVASDTFFEFDSADLGTDAVPVLEAIARHLAKASDTSAVTVEGHTDSVGDDGYNLDLSQRRADAVADWLAEHGGIDPSRIETSGYGSAFPIAPNQTRSGDDDPDGRAQNRRVTITVAEGGIPH